MQRDVSARRCDFFPQLPSMHGCGEDAATEYINDHAEARCNIGETRRHHGTPKYLGNGFATMLIESGFLSAWLTAGRLVEPTRKQAISLRLDPEVVDWFRNTGPRYQSRMNAVLRAFVEHQAHIVGPASKRKRVG
jgi:hypothetical protein